jgi:hypothetical protein
MDNESMKKCILTIVRRLFCDTSRVTALLRTWYDTRTPHTALYDKLLCLWTTLISADIALELVVDENGKLAYMSVFRARILRLDVTDLEPNEQTVLRQVCKYAPRARIFRDIVVRGACKFSACAADDEIRRIVCADRICARLAALLLYQSAAALPFAPERWRETRIECERAIINARLRLGDDKLNVTRDCLRHGSSAILSGNWDPANEYIPQNDYNQLPTEFIN